MNVEFEPLDLDEHMRLRLVLLDAWRAWDEQPGNKVRVNAYVDARIACFGAMHNEFAKFASAVRRAGGSRESALETWEADW